MIKPKFTEEDGDLLAELGINVEAEKTVVRTPREERIIAGFEEIEQFAEQHGQQPRHGEDKDIFERLYAVRLDQIRSSEECRAVLEECDSTGLPSDAPVLSDSISDNIDDEALLAELGIEAESESNITILTHVKTRAERRAAEEIAQRTPCSGFDQFKPLFIKVREDLKSGARKSNRFKKDTSIRQGEFFILGGQITYVANVGEEFKTPNNAADARLCVIYNNGTESNLLMRSLQRALYKDEAGRRILKPSTQPLLSDEQEDDDIESGTIYVLRSKSDHSEIKKNYEVLHKIGVTGGNIKKRIANAKDDPTFLMADVEVVATYKLSNINQVKLEKLIHRFFESARLNIEIKDRFGKPISPREWFLVPLFIIDEAVEKIREGSIVSYFYNSGTGKIIKQNSER